MKKRHLLLPVLILCLQAARIYPQMPVNGYARVNSIAGNTLTLTHVSETYETFEDGNWIVIMQMQDDVIGSNTGNNMSFGELSAIGNAGRYEIRQILSHTETASVPATITLASPLVNTYNTGPHSSVQIITLRRLGSPNYTTVADIDALPWDGNRGGVVAIEVPGTLTLAHNITANGRGFAGGFTNNLNGYVGCDDTTFRAPISMRYAGKGEGIYRNTDTGFAAGRAKILSGGGGANDVNSGGGGGSNYTFGGYGGMGWITAGSGCIPGVGGYGGVALSGVIDASRIFMGGGGGGGHENNDAGSPGASGGGIVLIKAGSIATTGGCGGRMITANGSSASNAGNDGSGGGGAGGSIVLEVGSYSIAAGCPLSILSNGGDGGSSVAPDTHGGGGGGGQGIIVFSVAMPTSNTIVYTLPGSGGCDQAACTTLAGDGGGPTNIGIITNLSGPLPVELLSLKATQQDDAVLVEWVTASEINCSHFELEHATGTGEYELIREQPCAGNSNTIINYSSYDQSPSPGTNYYRLRQVDVDGSATYYGPVSVSFQSQISLGVYPNPADAGSMLHLQLPEIESATAELYSMQGTLQQSWNLEKTGMGKTTIQLDPSLPAGIYTIRITNGQQVVYHRLSVK